jgi:type IX secretion system PorP/SprF family membrane protein
MKKILLTAGIIGLFTTTGFGQQDIQFTQFMNNRLFYNPGVAGSSKSICITGVHRSQWVGFDNAPTTQNINAEIPISAIRGALMVNISNDQIGFFRDITAGVGYAYQLDLGEGTLGFGLRVDFRNTSITQGDWLPPESLTDPNLGKVDASDMAPDLNFGVHYERSDFWAGISSSRLLTAESELDNTASPAGLTRLKGVRHFFFMGGYNWEIPNTAFKLSPAIMVKSDLAAPPQFDINLSGWYNNQIMAGVTYRATDAVALMAGYQITPQLRAFYSYDITTSALTAASKGSHEIVVNYCFTIEIPPKEKGYYRNPRFL